MTLLGELTQLWPGFTELGLSQHLSEVEECIDLVIALMNKQVGEEGSERRFAQLFDRCRGHLVARALRLSGKLVATQHEIGWSNGVELVCGDVEVHSSILPSRAAQFIARGPRPDTGTMFMTEMQGVMGDTEGSPSSPREAGHNGSAPASV